MQGLGTLEQQVMDVLWSSDSPLSVHDLVDELTEAGRQPAYNTVLTVATHLWEKDWVRREKVGRAYYYRPRRSRAEATTDRLRQILDASPDAPAALLHFARTATERETDALRRGLAEKSARE